ncbi:ATP-binding protein [Desulfovibrio sp. OttesenSCG-928-G11]|nr:ATP-binding protein [Desulfovibrio sp. OttesenSCG-928-G11]
MSEGQSSFEAGIDFESVLRIISKQIYETPLAFLRENVQNAVDAVLIQAHREQANPADSQYRIDIMVNGHQISIRDNGIGMTKDELQTLYWTIGASGKRTQEATAAGCVGTFGIGGFANFGVCSKLEVISKTEAAKRGTLTYLSQDDIQKAGAHIPRVTATDSDDAAPRGTIVVGHLRNDPNLEEMRRYLRDFVRFVPIAVFFNGEKVSQSKFTDLDDKENLKEVSASAQQWDNGNLSVFGRLFEDRGHTLVAAVEALSVDGQRIALSGQIRFEAGLLDVFKRGFKLCATQIPSTIGVTGRLDSDCFVPTAGRDSLDDATTALLGKITQALERAAVLTVLDSPERIAQHTRVFRYIIKHALIEKLGKVPITLADGSNSTLADIRRRSEAGGASVFFGSAQKQALNQIMQTRGHVVVALSGDSNRQSAEQQYLQRYCSAKQLDGMIDIIEPYVDLTRFHKLFLSELELNINKSYAVHSVNFLPGKLTEDIPIFVREHGKEKKIDILVDVKHQEIAKLESLGITSIFYSLVSTFCHEYLGPSLKKWSPRFFGNGALNLEFLSKRRSELWILVKDDVGIVHKGGQKQVVTRSDVHVVDVRPSSAEHSASTQFVSAQPGQPKAKSRILKIVDDDGATGISGYYIRMPDSAFNAYGDLLPDCESRGVVWAGNKIEYVISDTISAAFKYEIRLDLVVAATTNSGEARAEGAIPLDRPLQQMFDGLYFPIPALLEPFLVPDTNSEIRLELFTNWFDTRTAKRWTSKEDGDN